MKWHRINAIVVRHFYLFPRSFDRITDALFWPILDVILWGLTSQWMTQGNPVNRAMMLSVLTALIFWRVVWQANYEVGMNLLEECWNRNLTNIFSSPLTKWEWIIGNLLVGILKLALMIAITAGAIWGFYSMNVFGLGWLWIVYCISATMAGWCIGFFASALIMYFGTRAQALAWTLAFLFAPISAVYFPVELLPAWLKPIALTLPTTYIFEGMRSQILENKPVTGYFGMCIGLNLVYLVAALMFFNFMFEKTRERGFDHLE